MKKQTQGQAFKELVDQVSLAQIYLDAPVPPCKRQRDGSHKIIVCPPWNGSGYYCNECGAMWTEDAVVLTHAHLANQQAEIALRRARHTVVYRPRPEPTYATFAGMQLPTLARFTHHPDNALTPQGMSDTDQALQGAVARRDAMKRDLIDLINSGASGTAVQGQKSAFEQMIDRSNREISQLTQVPVSMLNGIIGSPSQTNFTAQLTLAEADAKKIRDLVVAMGVEPTKMDSCGQQGNERCGGCEECLAIQFAGVPPGPEISRLNPADAAKLRARFDALGEDQS